MNFHFLTTPSFHVFAICSLYIPNMELSCRIYDILLGTSMHISVFWFDMLHFY